MRRIFAKAEAAGSGPLSQLNAHSLEVLHLGQEISKKVKTERQFDKRRKKPTKMGILPLTICKKKSRPRYVSHREAALLVFDRKEYPPKA